MKVLKTEYPYTKVSMFVALKLQSTTKGAAINENDLWVIAIILSGAWLTAMITLLMSSEKGLRQTFYQATRAWEYNKVLFDTGIDEYRMSIFTDHREYVASEAWMTGEERSDELFEHP